jgi:hypothetical protein
MTKAEQEKHKPKNKSGIYKHALGSFVVLENISF